MIESYSKSMFNFLRNYQVGFHSDRGNVLHSHQQYKMVLIYPHSCQDLLLSVFFIRYEVVSHDF